MLLGKKLRKQQLFAEKIPKTRIFGCCEYFDYVKSTYFLNKQMKSCIWVIFLFFVSN